jgi:hypothetical protein
LVVGDGQTAEEWLEKIVVDKSSSMFCLRHSSMNNLLMKSQEFYKQALLSVTPS